MVREKTIHTCCRARIFFKINCQLLSIHYIRQLSPLVFNKSPAKSVLILMSSHPAPYKNLSVTPLMWVLSVMTWCVEGGSGAKTQGFPPLMRLPARNHHHYLRINFLSFQPSGGDIRQGAGGGQESITGLPCWGGIHHSLTLLGEESITALPCWGRNTKQPYPAEG
jgi:hypothetical protein